MSGQRDESIVLESLLDAAERLVELGHGVQRGHIGGDRDDRERILWNLVVLGEASKRLSEELRCRFADVPWIEMARTRGVVAHHYDGIVWARVSEVICDQLPPLLPRLVEIRKLVRSEFDAAEAARSR
ncbi:MAG: HepT-like ribonuclease domain-containing protein [Dermatophilaceae bacterium]